MLTVKQEKFVQNIVKGMSQREAYKNSYDASKMSDDTIDNKACNLFKQDKIRARYDELLRRIEDKTIMSATDRQIWLSKVIRGDIKVVSGYGEDAKEYDPYMSDRIKAVDVLNRMDGQYVTKIDADVNSDITINVELSDD